MTDYIDMLTDLLNDYDARGDRDPFEIVAEYAERIENAKAHTYTISFTDHEVSDLLASHGLPSDDDVVEYTIKSLCDDFDVNFMDTVVESASYYLEYERND